MVNFKIDEEMKALALKHSNERLKYEFNRFGFDSDKRKNMILIGTLGQLVFKKFLDNQKIAYNYQLQAGKYDDFDFEINDEIYEIKTSGYSQSFSKLNLLYSHDQYISGLNKNFKYCVQIFVNGFDVSKRIIDIRKVTDATIVGYIEFEKIIEYKNNRKYYGDDYKIPIVELKNIEILLKATP